MNNVSLSHTHVKNQSSWIDDPFGLKGFIKGVVPLCHERNLEDYANEIVANYAIFNGNGYELFIDKLSTPYQLELARHYIESIDREIEWACYGDDQSIDSEFLCALLAMLKNSTQQTREKFAQVTTKNILTYYKDKLQEILDEACHQLYCNEMSEAGFRCEQDMEDGSFVWNR